MGEEWRQRISAQRNGEMLLAENPDGGLIHYGEELGVSLITYTCCAVIALGVLEWRRKHIGGEFGGPAYYKYGTSFLFLFLWFIYLGISSWYSIDQENKHVKC